MEMFNKSKGFGIGPGAEFNNVGRDNIKTTFYQDCHFGGECNPRNITITCLLPQESSHKRFDTFSSCPDCRVEHENIRSIVQSQPEAGRWLLKHKSYISWKAANSPSLLWLSGIPGSGKTVLSSGVINDIQKTPNVVFYFYCDTEDPTSRRCDPTHLLASLLNQQLQNAPPDSPTKSHMQEQCLFEKPLDNLPLTTFIINLSHESKGSKKTFVIIDGLDKCNNLGSILPKLTLLAEELYVFVSSRETRDIRAEFSGRPRIVISPDDITNDVQTFVKKGLKRVGVEDPTLHSYIARELVSGTQGNFLWPACHIRQLQRLRTRSEIQGALDGVPWEMREIFVKSLEAIDALGRSCLLSALRLVIFAVGPITLRALAQAVAISDTGDRLDPDLPAADRVRYDAYWPKNGLNVERWWEVVASEHSHIVVPFHPSVSKFFRESQKEKLVSLEKYFFGPPCATHKNLAELCLGYLSIISKSKLECDPESTDFSFANYAVFAWLLHIRGSGKGITYFQKLFPPWEKIRALVSKTMHVVASPDFHSCIDEDKDILNWYVPLARQIGASGDGAEESVEVPPDSPVSSAPSRIGSNWETVDAYSTSSFEDVTTSDIGDFPNVTEHLESIAEDELEDASPDAPINEACPSAVSRSSVPRGHHGPRETSHIPGQRSPISSLLWSLGSVIPFNGNIIPVVPSELKADLYRRLMLLHPYGYPLYQPEPGKYLPPRIRKEGVRVGDVGLVTEDGSFDFLFNIFHYSDNPLRVPDSFVQILAWELFPPDTHLLGGGMMQTLGQDGRIKYRCSATSGAVLELPLGANNYEAIHLEAFRNLATRHAENWYRYTFLRDRGAQNGSLYLITGCVKTKIWGIAVYDAHSRTEGYLEFVSNDPRPGQPRSARYSWRQSPHLDASANIGPCTEGIAIEDDEEDNQCVFIKGYRLMIAGKVWKSLKDRPEAH